MKFKPAKTFVFNGENCVKIGTVELTEAEAKEAFAHGQNYVLVRTHAYFFKIEDGVVLYAKIPTIDKNNTLPHRFFIRSWGEIEKYIPDNLKG